MRRGATISIFALALAGAACPKGPAVAPSPRRTTELPRARDPDVTVREELDAARRERTVAAYDRFIARYPDHPLATFARKERGELSR